IQSYLEEDENYVVHSSKDADRGKLAITEYEVLKETDKFSLLKINLLTGKKNQIRVHLAGEGHAIVGDAKYGKAPTKFKDLYLHSAVLEFTHPFNQKRLRFTAPVPHYFKTLITYDF
ncbi:MAG: RNA pseudouridine synthase, partial [Bdellovibrio sp.]